MFYIVATPIGNLEDITLRALRLLKEADLILAEDTRKTGMLLARYGIKKPLISFHEHNEQKKIPGIVEQVKAGKNIALVSNAGTPTISDPGYKLVRAIRKEGLPITSLPGPSSIINALAMSSLPHDKFAFLGYLPRKSGERRKLLAKVKGWECVLVCFESPFRIAKSLADIGEVLGNKPVSLTREMTKKFEEVVELPAEEAGEHLKTHKPRGEFTVIIDNK